MENKNFKSQEEKMELTPKETLGKLILNIGNIPAILAGGLLSIGGLLLFLSSMGNRTEGAWVDPAGFGQFIGLFTLVLGVVILGLWYPSRLGPRSPSWTIFGICINLLIGLVGIVFLITGLNEYTIGLGIPVAILATITIITGLTSLLGWWLRGLFN